MNTETLSQAIAKSITEELEKLPVFYAYLERLQEQYPTEETGIVISNETRDIYHDEECKYIFLHLHAQNKLAVASYDPALFAYMANPQKAWYQVAGRRGVDERIQICFSLGHRGARWTPHLSRYLYFYYRSGLSPDDFRKDAKRRLNQSKKHVDHVNNDIYNDCRWNLALIRPEENVRSGKSDLVSRIKAPYFFYPVIDAEGIYRVQFGWFTPSMDGRIFYFRCRTIKALTALLREILSSDLFAEDMTHPLRTPAEEHKRNPKGIYMIGNYEHDLPAAEKLLAMPLEAFQEWTVNERFALIPVREFFGLNKGTPAAPIERTARRAE